MKNNKWSKQSCHIIKAQSPMVHVSTFQRPQGHIKHLQNTGHMLKTNMDTRQAKQRYNTTPNILPASF